MVGAGAVAVSDDGKPVVSAQMMRTALEYVDGQLVGVRDQMAEAKASEDKGRRDVLREQFLQRKKEAEAAKAKKEERGAQFKVVTQPSEKIIQEGHPSGWVNRTQERVETANKGREWRSEA